MSRISVPIQAETDNKGREKETGKRPIGHNSDHVPPVLVLRWRIGRKSCRAREKERTGKGKQGQNGEGNNHWSNSSSRWKVFPIHERQQPWL